MGHGETDVSRSTCGDVLDNHVDRDFLLRDWGKNFVNRAGHIWNIDVRNQRLVARQSRSTDWQRRTSGCIDDQRSWHIAQSTTHVNRDIELLAELNRATVHDASAKAGKFQHLVVANPFNQTRLR